MVPQVFFDHIDSLTLNRCLADGFFNFLKFFFGLEQGIWSAFHLKSGAHLWWWDYIHDHSLYDEFVPLSVYAEGEDLAAHNLSHWLRGSWHPALRSDPTFTVGMDGDGVLRIHIDAVGPDGRNSLGVLLSRREIFSASYPNGSSDFVIEVPIRAGSGQQVRIVNTGGDWFRISSYEFEETADTNVGYLKFIGLSGNDHAYVWAYDVGSQRGYTDHGIFSDVNCLLKGLDDGEYAIDFYETRGTGGIFESVHAQSENGELLVTLPQFTKGYCL